MVGLIRRLTTSNALATFNFNSNEIRVVTIDDQPWFVAADVCRVLKLSNTTVVVSELVEHQRAKLNLGQRGLCAVNCVSKGGLFSLILSSRKPEAKAFKLWVTDTVLPAIEQDGAYIMGEEKVASGQIRRFFHSLYTDVNKSTRHRFTPHCLLSA